MQPMDRIRIGTTSWTDKTLIESRAFYPPGVTSAEQRLRYYASRFPVVEVDSTYYGLPSESNARLWSQRTPPGFVFHVKAFRLFTLHQTPPQALPPDLRARLGAPAKRHFYYRDLPPDIVDELWRRFALALEPLRASGRLGAIVFQFAPWMQYAEEHFDHIARCAERLRDDLLAVEFRNKSWLNDRTRDATLEFERRLGLVHVITDEPQGFANSVPPVWEVTNPKLALVRLHGRNAATWRKATGSAAERFDYLYTEAELREFVEPIKQVAAGAAETHVLFNNCRDNKAQLNAGDLAKLLVAGGGA
jgi:uncharacterized protein YecE (DUF72 family)